MFKRWLGLLALALASVAFSADQVPVPALSGAVVDLTATLSPAQARSLDSELRAFSQRRGSQVAVLMVPTTKPETIEQYSIRVAEAWKIGRARIDDGVILVVAKDDRALRIEVGYGLEGAIPDAVAKRVIEEVIVPRFRAGDFDGGVRAGVASLMKLIEGEKLPPPAAERWQTGWTWSDVWLFALLLALVIGGAVVVIFGMYVLMLGSESSRARYSGGGSGRGSWSGGGWGGGFSGGGGFGGGGGSFGGGGASGSW